MVSLTRAQLALSAQMQAEPAMQKAEKLSIHKQPHDLCMLRFFFQIEGMVRGWQSPF